FWPVATQDAAIMDRPARRRPMRPRRSRSPLMNPLLTLMVMGLLGAVAFLFFRRNEATDTMERMESRLNRVEMELERVKRGQTTAAPSAAPRAAPATERVMEPARAETYATSPAMPPPIPPVLPK